MLKETIAQLTDVVLEAFFPTPRLYPIYGSKEWEDDTYYAEMNAYEKEIRY